jgi:hypothetical protein
MADDTLTLRLDGEVSLAAFRKAIESFADLVDALAEDITPSAVIAWVVTHLEAGSAVATIRGQPAADDQVDDVARVVHAYAIVGKALESNNVIPYSPRVQDVARKLTDVLDGRVTAIHLQTAKDDATVVQRWTTDALTLVASYGVVEGRVLTLASRRHLTFTLYDTVYDRAVICYVEQGREDEIWRAWRKRVVVEGWVSRDPITGQPATVHDIGTITVLDDETVGGFERARGAAPRRPDAPRAEEAIRRVRAECGTL